MGMLRTATQRLALVLFGLTLALLLAEGFLRLLGVGRPAELGPTFDRADVLFHPTARQEHPWTRDVEDPFRIAVIGDSFTVGETNHWYDAYPARLERLLNLNDGVRPVEVQSYARKGSATLEQVRLLNESLRRGTDLVIVGIFLNDSEWYADPELVLFRERRMPRIPEGWKGALLRTSRALGWTFHRFELMRCAQERRAYMAHIFDREYEGWRRFERALDLFVRGTDQANVPLVAVIFPTMAALENYPDRAAHIQIAEALAYRGVPTLDLLDTFTGTSDARMAAFPGIDAHPSEIAHRVAADAIFRYLINAKHIDAGYQPQKAYVERREEAWLNLTRRMLSPYQAFDNHQNERRR